MGQWLGDCGITLYRQDQTGAVQLEFFQAGVARNALYWSDRLPQREPVNRRASRKKSLFKRG